MVTTLQNIYKMLKREDGSFQNRPYILVCYKTKKEQGKLQILSVMRLKMGAGIS